MQQAESSKARCFHLIDKIDDQTRLSFIDEIEKSDLWFDFTKRQETLFVQAETNSIILRSHVPDTSVNNVDNDMTCDVHIARFPLIAAYLYRFAENLDTTLARAMAVRLKPWGEVYRHIDLGHYYEKRDRFHIVLTSPNGSDMTCERQARTFREGEVWWFHNGRTHQSFNYSNEWRTHIIFDVETNDFKKQSATIPKIPKV